MYVLLACWTPPGPGLVLLLCWPQRPRSAVAPALRTRPCHSGTRARPRLSTPAIFHPMPTAARRPAAAGYRWPASHPVTPSARPGMTHREQSMRRRIKSTHIGRFRAADYCRIGAGQRAHNKRLGAHRLSCWCRLGLAGQGRGRLLMARVRRSRRCSSGAGRLSIPCGSTGSRPSVRCQCARLGRSADAVRAVRWA